MFSSQEINNEQKKSSWIRAVNLPEANQLLKFIPEVVPTLNSCAHMMRKNTIFCFRTIITNKDDLANTSYKYKTQYVGNVIDIYNGVGDQYCIVLTGMVP